MGSRSCPSVSLSLRSLAFLDRNPHFHPSGLFWFLCHSQSCSLGAEGWTYTRPREL